VDSTAAQSNSSKTTPADRFGLYDLPIVDASTNPDTRVLQAPDGTVYLQTNSPMFAQATDFMIAIAEVLPAVGVFPKCLSLCLWLVLQPYSRPRHIHEYKITATSLYAAASIGMKVLA
jgi:hypothetical protein